MPSSRFSPVVRRFVRLAALLGAGFAGAVGSVRGQAPEEEVATPRPMYIRQYRIQGSKTLPGSEVQTIVYPFLGPGRLPGDVDKACAALEKAYHDKGYKTVTVSVPQQKIRQGVVYLRVEENPVGRLRVRGANYTAPGTVKRLLPSLEEGKPMNFDRLTEEMVATTQYPGLEVSPKPKAGVEPGTWDVDLEVKDQMPLHGSIELNNRYSDNTTPLRLNGALNYDNLWQRGHSLSLSGQIAPENENDAKSVSAAYTFRWPDSHGWSVILQGTKQDSDISTLGGLAVVGKGETLGVRAVKVLPASANYTQTLSLGMDYKHYGEELVAGTSFSTTPLTYYPLSILYSSSLKNGAGRTEFNGGINWHMRGMGSSQQEFSNKRYQADGGYIYFRGDISHTHDLKSGYQWFAKVQGQASSQALVNSEQFSAGGLGSVRGYLESESLGDDAAFGTLELRSPSLIGKGWSESDDLRVYVFADGGVLTLHDALPGQDSGQTLGSLGIGARGRLYDHFNGSLDAALPIFSRPTGKDTKVMYTFRLWGDF